MEYRNLGKSGLKVSALSLGSWVTFGKQVDVKLAKKLMSIAYEAGINFFDNAEVYGQGASEIIMGKALKELGWERDSYIISSKVFFGRKKDPLPTQKGLSRKHIMEACDQALESLQLDYLDLFYCHRPDPEVPTKEIVFAMNDLIKQGKILYWGTSEWEGTRIMHAHAIAEKYNLLGPVMEQPQYNLFVRRKVEVEFDYIYKTVGLGTTVWSPLASGYLTGKYLKNEKVNGRLNIEGYEWLYETILGTKPEEKKKAVEQFVAYAQELGYTPAQLALAWTVKKPFVSTVILGASKPEQLKENLKALDISNKLSEEEIEKIEKKMYPASDLDC